jgi:hypothetical protein
VEQLLEGEAEAIARALIDKAKAGDAGALAITMARLCPARKEPTLELPDLPEDAVAAHTALIKAVSAGALTPQQGRTMAELLEARQRAVELTEFAARLGALEEWMATSKTRR